jgi:large subunit ribosomal protein L28
MPKRCDLTGKRPQYGNSLSHLTNGSRRRWEVNLQWKAIVAPELGWSVRLRVSARVLRTIDRKGLVRFLRDEGLTLRDVTS